MVNKLSSPAVPPNFAARSAGGLDGGIQREPIGLSRNGVDQFDRVSDRRRSLHLAG